MAIRAPATHAGKSGHVFQSLHGLRPLNHLNHLDLVELMLSDHVTSVTARSTCLTTKAWAVGDKFEGQSLCVENLPSRQIGQWDFRGRDQIEVSLTLSGDLERGFFKFRQLAGTLKSRRMNHVGDVGFLIAML